MSSAGPIGGEPAGTVGPLGGRTACTILRECVAASLLGLCLAASAQTIYKCKGADGRVTYSGVPCQGEGARFTGMPAPKAAADATNRGGAAPDADTNANDGPAPPPIRVALPRQCDNAAMLKIVVARLDSPATPDEIRPFLAGERFRLLRCEYTRFTPAERRERDSLMREVEGRDPARCLAAAQRIEALYDRYLSASERAVRARTRPR
jgi:hypothetical protein